MKCAVILFLLSLYTAGASPVGQSTTVITSQSQSSPGIQATTTIVNGHIVDHVVSSSPSTPLADMSSLLAGIVPLGVLPTLNKQATQPLTEEAPLLSAPINQTTKLVIDVNEQITKFLPAEDANLTTIAPPMYMEGPMESKQVAPTATNPIQSLIDQVTRLSDTIDTTISDLGNRGRNATAALLRSTLNYVRRVRTNLERLQVRLPGQNVTVDSAASSNATTNTPFFNSIRDRINRMTEEIGALVTRIRGTFIPTPVESSSTPLPTPVNPIGAAVASGTILSTINSLNSQKFIKPSVVVVS